MGIIRLRRRVRELEDDVVYLREDFERAAATLDQRITALESTSPPVDPPSDENPPHGEDPGLPPAPDPPPSLPAGGLMIRPHGGNARGGVDVAETFVKDGVTQQRRDFAPFVNMVGRRPTGHVAMATGGTTGWGTMKGNVATFANPANSMGIMAAENQAAGLPWTTVVTIGIAAENPAPGGGDRFGPRSLAAARGDEAVFAAACRGRLETCANGGFDDHYRDMFGRLAGGGIGQVGLRLLHENGGHWYPWCMSFGNADVGRAAWLHLYDLAKTVFGEAGAEPPVFLWNTSVAQWFDPPAHVDGPATWPWGATAPEDVIVDVDFYIKDLSAGAWPTRRDGLNRAAQFAADHNAPIAVTEWGISVEADAKYPHLMGEIADWFDTQGRRLWGQCYFQADNAKGLSTSLDLLVNGGPVYVSRFGG